MPNHVYSRISVDDKYSDKLKEIAEVGLCEYFKPFPKDLENTTSPAKIVSQEEYDEQMEKNKTSEWKSYPLTEEMNRELLSKYLCNNWYAWKNQNWGTKWGCYDTDFDGNTYTFTTAWSPVGDSIIAALLEVIPSFEYFWEEEQGFGAEMIYEDGEETHYKEWDLPDWEDVEGSDMVKKFMSKYDQLTKLSHDYENAEGVHKKGYYLNYNFNEYLGATIHEAIDQLKEFNQSINN
mgnify:CR=1 FL=1|tara:strand:+ start:439 stop:1143 length:705 start_codon:yes stop_codon:yes gene_type:complete